MFLALVANSVSFGAVYNLKVVTDASPDYSDLPSLVHSATSKWNTPEEKCWAMFYWNHIARRQTAPMNLHGMALTDPIRQFNDYGFTMCSTISGINCSIWDAMGFKTKYWDISNHTVSEVEYGGRWHMYDNSMSALYTLCDGKTIAGVEDVGAARACDASGGKSEPGHVAKYHCLMATSTRGFLTGADTIRSLDEEYRCFNPNGLKYRSYFYDWDRGHRYVLDIRDGESYTRHYTSLGKTAEFFVPNSNGKDPEAANTRYHIRGNGVWKYKPTLSAADANGERVFKVNGANVITALKIHAEVFGRTAKDTASISVSTCNGLSWQQVWQGNPVGEQTIEQRVVKEVNGAYEVLVKIAGAELRDVEFETTTMLNSKTQPKLLLGKNTIYVGAGEQTENIVVWPDLQGTNYKAYVVEERNIATKSKHPGYQGVMFLAKPKEPAQVIFRVDAPHDITRVNYGGRLYNRAPKSQIAFEHSFDGGKTWARTYTLTDTEQPWDVIRYESVEAVPPGTRSVLFKYALESSAAGTDACSLYAVRMEVNHKPSDATFRPLDVTFNWSERQADYSLAERSHTERVEKLPHRFMVNVAGSDHPVVNSLEIASASSKAKPGYSDGKDVHGEKFVPRWVTYGKNFARGKTYKVSVPSETNWGAGDPDGTKLTDGLVGPPYPGGTAPASALLWNKGQKPQITVDLGEEKQCGAFRIQLGAGYPWWDALKGQFKDKVEVLTSADGNNFTSHGFFDLNLRWKNLPVNHFWPDEEVIAGHNFELIPPKPVAARYVKYNVTPERALTVSEVEVLDFIRYEPFDLRIALPDERVAAR
jgi:hypothetical protein